MMPTEGEEPKGIRLVALLKALKCLIAVSMGLLLAALLTLGYDRSLHELALTVRHNATSVLSLRVADYLLMGATKHGMGLTALALILDGLLAGVEAWALHHAHWWGPWLVVSATSCLLPFEVYHFLRHVTAGRLTLFLVNLTLVLYLTRHALRARAVRKLRATATENAAELG